MWEDFKLRGAINCLPEGAKRLRKQSQASFKEVGLLYLAHVNQDVFHVDPTPYIFLSTPFSCNRRANFKLVYTKAYLSVKPQGAFYESLKGEGEILRLNLKVSLLLGKL